MSELSDPAGETLNTAADLRFLIAPHLKTRERLIDEIARTAWYFEPLYDRVERIDIFYAGDDVSEEGFQQILLNFGDYLPDYFDPVIPSLAKRWGDKLIFHIDPSGSVVRGWAEKCDAIVVAEEYTGETEVITETVARRIGLIFINASVDHNISEAANRSHLVQHFLGDEWHERRKYRGKTLMKSLDDSVAGRPVNVYGSGPSMRQLVESRHDFGDVAHIICNSMVNNQELLSLITPSAVVCGDPVFHAGPSKYAAEFRASLTSFMKKFTSTVVVTTTDLIANILAGLDDELHERVIGLDFIKDRRNLDLLSNIEVCSTENILTMIMLPLAYTVTNQVAVVGCDGRRFQENGYFWSHDKKSQFDAYLDQTQLVHPAFFRSRSYDGYYLTHCKVLEDYLQEGESMGKVINAITPSRIPPLAKRYKATL